MTRLCEQKNPSQVFSNELEDREYRDAFVEELVRTQLALQIRVLRRQRGMSQRAFAKLVGKPQSCISRLESEDYGRVTLTTLFDVAKALDIALKVAFCEIIEVLEDACTLTESRLEIRSFEKADLVRMPPSAGLDNMVLVTLPPDRATLAPNLHVTTYVQPTEVLPSWSTKTTPPQNIRQNFTSTDPALGWVFTT